MAATGHTRHNNTTQQNTHQQHNKHTSTRLISLGPAQLHEMKIVPLQSKEGQKGVDNEQLKKRKQTSTKGSLAHSESKQSEPLYLGELTGTPLENRAPGHMESSVTGV